MGWHEHDHRLFPRHRAILPPWLQGEPRRRVDSGAGRRFRTSSNAARRSPTSAVGTGPPRSSWPRPSRTPSSSALTITTPRSSVAARSGRRRGASPDGSPSRWLRPRTSRAAATTSSACFDCLPRHGRPRGRLRACAGDARRGRRLDDRRAVRPTTASSRTSTRWGASSTVPRRSFARRRRCRRRVGLALGAQAGEARLTEVLEEGGFTRVRARDRDAVQPDPRGSALIGPETAWRRELVCHNPQAMKLLRLKPGHGEIVLAEGDVELPEQEQELIEAFSPRARCGDVGGGAAADA